MTPPEFAHLMQRELDANAHKGDWASWTPAKKELLAEFSYHFAKLCLAIGADEPLKVSKFGADVGNLTMKIVEILGPQQ